MGEVDPVPVLCSPLFDYACNIYVKEEDYWKIYLDQYIDFPEEVMDVQLCPEEDGSMMAYSAGFMEKMLKQENMLKNQCHVLCVKEL